MLNESITPVLYLCSPLEAASEDAGRGRAGMIAPLPPPPPASLLRVAVRSLRPIRRGRPAFMNVSTL